MEWSRSEGIPIAPTASTQGGGSRLDDERALALTEVQETWQAYDLSLVYRRRYRDEPA